METDKLLKTICRITSVKPIYSMLICFVAVPLIARFLFKIHFTVTAIIYILILYMVLQMSYAVWYRYRFKKIIHDFFSEEYAEIYESDSLTSLLRGPIGNLHGTLHVDKVLDEPDKYDETLVTLYLGMDAITHATSIAILAGYPVLVLLYMFVIL